MQSIIFCVLTLNLTSLKCYTAISRLCQLSRCSISDLRLGAGGRDSIFKYAFAWHIKFGHAKLQFKCLSASRHTKCYCALLLSLPLPSDRKPRGSWAPLGLLWKPSAMQGKVRAIQTKVSNDALGTDAADFLCFGCFLTSMCMCMWVWVWVWVCVAVCWVVRLVDTHLHFTGLLSPGLAVAAGPLSIDL